MNTFEQVEIPFTVDHVGSFLRPERLKTARKDYFNEEITKKELRNIEDKEIEKLVEKEKKVGLHGITDGEFRRGFWHLDFLEHLNGVEGYVPEGGYNQQFHGKAAPSYNIRVTDRISFNEEHPFLEDFIFLKEKVGGDKNTIAKASVPSPNMILRQELLANDGTTKIYEIYPDLKDFYHDLAQTYKDVIKAYYEKGCRYLQFDDTNWAFLADADKRKALQKQGIDPKNIARICAEIINEALEDKPKDLTLTTHICRGNHASSWLFSGGYEPIAEELFATNYDGFFLEYDSDRAGDFAPLRYWNNKNSKIVLGLVTSKFPELESKEEIKSRIKEATAYVPLENLSISPQCGFASTEEGNRLTEQEQWEKINLLQEVAADVWQ
ncbi:5-methyltetrahydropteroyltriglutamate--homocysteine S-methyltransferase [Tetragenococcus halophilus]|uniref:5-methyltetrahydropteroyltriglutamate--homocysteine S-methyltransferase n=1 Tax=Tetragenococcus halophilus TaxID=51669 RepID=A0AB35HR88_TETHA|nr:5-methyltetrahydropteroyltriglutamate--homocysteine S-methyltransferase [Tetragenococcus halophilus]AOF48003.1 5-methyltetrahydropteroyltriglutamate--homocysteine methyltransferase [Tetragenococcus halophilus]MCF1602225.1 5-methyltetrahydropteroyltriglutamate--homocysteine S-methyltransferase [Tetragenococcus halophilus]MCO8284282.1 5-methyltetrahydropteroyltriglutamate--homocysteine S-methyltransferase [Tetragenococcus halophilus]MCO8290817.1 5-methyltetrahydropteroyltriglutamate--homocyste